MDDFYYEEESNGKKVFIKCLIILFIIGLCIGIFFFLKKQNNIKLKNVTIELGDEIPNDVEFYLSNGKKYSSHYKLYLNDVDKNNVGTYTYKVKYNKHEKTAKIKIVDTTAPKVSVEESITIGKDEKLDPVIFINKCDDYSLPCEVNYKDKDILNKIKTPGTYKVELIISDKFGNKTEASSNLIVSENGSLSSEKTNDLNYSYNSLDLDIDHTLFIKFDKAMDEYSEDFDNIYNEVAIEDFSKYKEDIKEIKLIKAYNKYGYVIGIQVLATDYDGIDTLLERKEITYEETEEE